MNIKFKIIRTVNVSKAVCLWNTWDHEHLYFVHKQFGNSKILFENSNLAVIQTTMKIPYLPISFNSLHTLISLSNLDVLVIDTMPFGIMARLLMEYKEINPQKTKLVNTYEINLPFYFIPLKKIIKKMILKWNAINWVEDMPLKMRRMQALQLGFIDFYGIPKNQAIKNTTIKLDIKLPLPRLKDSILNE